MLLPTGHFILGGALAVAVSFLAATVIPARHYERFFAWRRPIGTLKWPPSPLPSLISGVFLLAIILAGFYGSRDPYENPLPLTIWTIWWVVIILAHAVFGNFWAFINPFSGVLTLTGAGDRAKAMGEHFRFLPALLIFAAFAWFQLVSPAPDDPSRLAVVVCIYAGLTLAIGWLSGLREWFAANDPFAAFMRLIARAAPLQFVEGGAQANVEIRVPGAGLADTEPLPFWGILFVLLTLSAVSYDGISHTFWWLSLGGVNPLDFPGRTALIGFNTFGLVASFLVLAVVFYLTVWLGWRVAGRAGDLRQLLGTMVLSLIPISIAFHFAHYLPDLLISGQYVAVVLNDPLAQGWDLLGLGHYHVTASFLNTPQGARTIYFTQTAAIVIGHVVSVAVAHLLLLRTGASGWALLKLEAPFAVLMVAYTAFGLWTLSSPSVG
jgi:hypothetical protein